MSRVHAEASRGAASRGTDGQPGQVKSTAEQVYSSVSLMSVGWCAQRIGDVEHRCHHHHRGPRQHVHIPLAHRDASERSRDRPLRGVRQPQPSSGWRHPHLCAAGLCQRQAWPSTMQNPSTPRYLTLPAPKKAAMILGHGHSATSRATVSHRASSPTRQTRLVKQSREVEFYLANTGAKALSGSPTFAAAAVGDVCL